MQTKWLIDWLIDWCLSPTLVGSISTILWGDKENDFRIYPYNFMGKYIRMHTFNFLYGKV